MFKEGDIVEIHVHNTTEHVMPGSPADNLDGSVCTIEKVYNENKDTYYKLKMLELVEKEKGKFEEYQMGMRWQDVHLLLHEDKINIEPEDMMALFE